MALAFTSQQKSPGSAGVLSRVIFEEIEMKRFGFALTGGLLTLLMSALAAAAPTCTTTLVATGGNGIFLMSTLATPGTCVDAAGKLFGDFSFSASFSDPASNVVFSLNTVAGQDHHQIAFNTVYLNGIDYSLGYEVEIFPVASPLTIVTLDADFTQTAGGPSELIKQSTPLGAPAAGIDLFKTGIVPTGNSIITYTPGVTDLVITETLHDHGTISSITDTVIESGTSIPEPASLALVGLGLSALAMIRRRKLS
jgi:hypothetical protein